MNPHNIFAARTRFCTWFKRSRRCFCVCFTALRAGLEETESCLKGRKLDSDSSSCCSVEKPGCITEEIPPQRLRHYCQPLSSDVQRNSKNYYAIKCCNLLSSAYPRVLLVQLAISSRDTAVNWYHSAVDYTAPCSPRVRCFSGQENVRTAPFTDEETRLVGESHFGLSRPLSWEKLVWFPNL